MLDNCDFCERNKQKYLDTTPHKVMSDAFSSASKEEIEKAGGVTSFKDKVLYERVIPLIVYQQLCEFYQ